MPTITFGAGCFWGVQEAFKRVKGVKKTEVGYMGGTQENPSYDDICYSNTGFTEVCKVGYLATLKFDKLLDVYLKLINVERNAKDQYRSIIFYNDSSQKTLAEKRIETLKLQTGRPVIVEVRKAEKFYSAETYHQDYYQKHKFLAKMFCKV